MYQDTSDKSGDSLQKWTIQRFSDLKVPNGKYLKSKPFCVHERTFRLVAYPNGDVEESEGHLSLYLLCETDDLRTNMEVKVDIRLGILNEGNKKFAKPPISVSMEQLDRNIYGYTEFIKSTSLNKSLLPMGNLTVYCELVFDS